MNILQSYGHIYVKTYLRKSVGLNLFRLLDPSYSSSVDTSLFGCVVILSL
jgi:hypothetical protein